MDAEHLLHLYLRDHLAAATGGVALARRIAQGHEASAAELRALADEVEQDRRSLAEVMTAVGARPDPVKNFAAQVGERLGRYIPNGALVRRSPLSDVVELEAMRLGVEGKLACWRSLRALADRDRRLESDRLDALIERARAQSELLESLRRKAATAAFAEGSRSEG